MHRLVTIFYSLPYVGSDNLLTKVLFDVIKIYLVSPILLVFRRPNVSKTRAAQYPFWLPPK
jgi:hypothetical protein